MSCWVSSTHPSHKVVPERRNSSGRGKNGIKGWKGAGEALGAQLNPDVLTVGTHGDVRLQKWGAMQSWGKACRAAGMERVCKGVHVCVCVCLWTLRCELRAAQGAGPPAALLYLSPWSQGREGLGQPLPSGWGMPEPGLSFVWNNRGLGPIVLPCTPSRKAESPGAGAARSRLWGCSAWGFAGREDTNPDMDIPNPWGSAGEFPSG